MNDQKKIQVEMPLWMWREVASALLVQTSSMALTDSENSHARSAQRLFKYDALLRAQYRILGALFDEVKA